MKPRTKSTITWIFYGLVIACLAIYIRKTDFSQLEGLSISVRYFVVATMLTLAFRYWGAFTWLVLLKELGARGLKDDRRELVHVYAKSWLGRYMAGTVPWLLGKIYFASEHGISKHKLAVSSLLEGALQILSTLALAFMLLTLDPRLDVLDDRIKWLMVVTLVGCIIIMSPSVFNRVISKVYFIIRKNELNSDHLASRRMVAKGILLYSIGALINGIAFFFIAKAMYPELDYENLSFIIGAGSLAAAIGMLAIFAPSGIGVREAVQVVLLSVLMPVEVAIIIAIVMRIWSVAVDLLFFGLSKLKFA